MLQNLFQNQPILQIYDNHEWTEQENITIKNLTFILQSHGKMWILEVLLDLNRSRKEHTLR